MSGESYESSLSDLFEGESIKINTVDASKFTSGDVDKIVEILGIEEKNEDQEQPVIDLEPEVDADPLLESNEEPRPDTEGLGLENPDGDVENRAEDKDTADNGIFLKDRYYLVVGRVDDLTTALIDRLINEENVDKIVVAGDDEKSLSSLKRSYPEVRIVTGEMSDRFTVDKIWSWYDPDGVFYVPSVNDRDSCELNVKETMLNVSVGCSNILDTCLDSGRSNVSFIIGITDTSASVGSGVYSSCMRMNERMFEQYGSVNRNTFHGMIRVGNVAGQCGSKIDAWREKIASNGTITVPSSNDSIFITTVGNIITDLFYYLNSVFEGKISSGASPYFSANNKAACVGDVVKTIGGLYGNKNKKQEVVESGLYDVNNLEFEFVSDNGLSSREEEKADAYDIRDMF